MEIELTYEEKSKMVCELYLKGFTYYEIMRATGYKTTKSISDIIKKNNLANRVIDNYPENLKNKIVEGWRDRKSNTQIGINLGLSRFQVRSVLRKLYLVD